MKVLGLDIGGANIKVSDADGVTAARAFPMWTRHRELPSVLREIAAEVLAEPDMVALTMTAELADCFITKQQGVTAVITAVVEAFPQIPLRIWLTSGEFAEPDDAAELSSLVAAANWHALATWAGRGVPDGPAILIDVGSTTTDIIPLLDGRPVPRGLSDAERLCSGELVYTGIGRTPVCAIVPAVPLRGQACPVAAEMFATSADAYIVMRLLPEDPSSTDSADHRPLTRDCSLNRLAHMICCDATELTAADLEGIAQAVIDQQVRIVSSSIERVFSSLDSALQEDDQRSIDVEKPVFMLSGSGACLAQMAIDDFGISKFSDRMCLPEMFHKSVAESACAFAVARLAHDLCRDDLLETSTL